MIQDNQLKSYKPSSLLLKAQESLFCKRNALFLKNGIKNKKPEYRFANLGKTCSRNYKEISPDSCRHFPSSPPHLGWHSQQLSSKGKCRKCSQKPEFTKPSLEETSYSNNNNITLEPALAATILQQGQAATARIWLLLRYLDEKGQGWIEESSAKTHLSKSDQPFYVCKWRQLQNLLRAGDGIFWSRTKGNIWLRSTAKVAFSLGIERLSGLPVVMPASSFCQSIGKVRAAFYAAFQSGQRKKEKHTQLIARQTLIKITGASRPTQRKYEKSAGIHCKTNYAIGNISTPVSRQKAVVNWGSSLFEYIDYKGNFGPQNKRYLARQLPNSFLGPYPQSHKNQQKRFNRQLADLSNKGLMGNGLVTSTYNSKRWFKRYFEDGKQAMLSRHCSEENEDVFWAIKQKINRKAQFWSLMPAI